MNLRVAKSNDLKSGTLIINGKEEEKEVHLTIYILPFFGKTPIFVNTATLHDHYAPDEHTMNNYHHAVSSSISVAEHSFNIQTKFIIHNWFKSEMLLKSYKKIENKYVCYVKVFEKIFKRVMERHQPNIDAVLKVLKYFNKNINFLNSNEIVVSINECNTPRILQSFKENRRSMKLFAADDENEVPEVVKLLLDDKTLVNEVNNILKVVGPISNVLNYCNEPDSNLGLALEKFLQEDISSLSLEDYELNQIYNWCAVLCNFFQPALRGKRIPRTYISELFSKMIMPLKKEIGFLHSYEGESGEFNHEVRRSLENEPKLYWQNIKFHCPILSEIALSYVSLPSSVLTPSQQSNNNSYLSNQILNGLSNELKEKAIFCKNFELMRSHSQEKN